MIPRKYQSEDIAAVLREHQQHQCVLGWAATGLGKGPLLAWVCQHYMKLGRVMVLVDRDKLVRQLAATIREICGVEPGIEMGDSFASNGETLGGEDRIIVSTFQTQCFGKEGNERYRRFKQDRFALVVADEGEIIFPSDTEFRTVMDHYLSNPDCRGLVVTATPIRTDGVRAANLCSAVAFERDIRWAWEEGWLVKAARGTSVSVSLDFSTLKTRRNEAGEEDYSQDQVADYIANEAVIVQIAAGIADLQKKHDNPKAVIMVPRVDIARALADRLNAENAGCCKAIYGTMTDEQKADTFDGYERGDFRVLSSCEMITKGFDSPAAAMLYFCRKTRSKRLYIQAIGRVLRPLPGVVDGPETAAARIAAIAASGKPIARVCNMVGLHDDLRDIDIVDVLGSPDDRVNLRAKQIMAEDEIEMDAALDRAEDEIAIDDAANELRAEGEQERLDAIDENDLIRRAFSIEADVQVEWSDDWRVGGASGIGGATSKPKMASERQARYIAYLSSQNGREWTFDKAMRLTGRQASGVISKLKQETGL